MEIEVVRITTKKNMRLPALTRLIQHWHQVLEWLETLLLLSFRGHVSGPCFLLHLVYPFLKKQKDISAYSTFTKYHFAFTGVLMREQNIYFIFMFNFKVDYMFILGFSI